MRTAIAVRTEFRTLSHLPRLISRVYLQQLGVIQQQIPSSSPLVQSDVALGIAVDVVRALWAHNPNSEAGCEAGELLSLMADHSPAPGNDFKQWAAQQLPDLSGDGFLWPRGSASQFLWEGMRLREVLAGASSAFTSFGTSLGT